MRCATASRENLYGYEAIAAFRAAQAPTDMARDLMNTVITTYGRDVATVNTEFQRVGATIERPPEPGLVEDRRRLARRRRPRQPAARAANRWGSLIR